MPMATPSRWAIWEPTPSQSRSTRLSALAYKPDVDFEPIGLVVEQPIPIDARKDLSPTGIQEFVAYVKANAENLNRAHAGVRSNVFNFGLVLNSILGVRPTMVPFAG